MEVKVGPSGVMHASEPLFVNRQRAIYGHLFRNADGLALKICQHKKSDLGKIDFDNIELLESGAQGVIRLPESGITALADLLSNNFAPLKLGAKHYVAVDSEETAEAIELATKALKDKSLKEKIDFIRKTGVSLESLTGAIEMEQRQLAVDQFKEMIDQKLSEPKVWQPWFENNSWVLGTDHVKVLDERDIDENNTSDFLLEAADGFLDLIEIKRPDLEFWYKARDHDNLVPHSDLTKAVTQAINYLYVLEQRGDSRRTAKRLGCPIARPRALLIHGRTEGWGEDELEAQRLYNASFSMIQVITFDQVLVKAQRLLLKNPSKQIAEEEPLPPPSRVPDQDEYDPFADD